MLGVAIDAREQIDLMKGYLEKFHLNEAEFTEMSESGRKVFRMDMEHVLYNEYRDEIFKISKNFRKGLVTESQMKIAKSEVRLDYIQLCTEKNYIYLLSRIANEAVLEIYDSADRSDD